MRDALYEEPGPRTRRRMHVATAVALLVVAAGLFMILRQFYITGQLDAKYWSFFTAFTTWTFMAQGLIDTLMAALSAGVLALLLGCVLMLGRISIHKPVALVSRIVIDFFRGIPSLLLIYFFFLVVPQYGIKLSSFWMIVLPVTFTASGVLAEVLRAGVNAVPRGQWEAAYSLGMRRTRILIKIILPQALRIVIPSLVSQLVVVVKDTTLGYVVSYPDLLQNARVLITNYDALVSTYFVVAVVYILINYAINQFSVWLARREGQGLFSRNTASAV
jgi:glutamate transport system permease protein